MPYNPPRIQSTAVPNAPNVEGDIPTTRESAERAAAVSSARSENAEVEAEALTMQQADARRTIPRARTDNFNPESGRRLTAGGETVSTPSIYSHRQNRRNSNVAIAKMNPAQRRVASDFIAPSNSSQQEIRDSLNTHFESGGSVNDLPDRSRRYTRQLDSAIQKAERENDRSHVVYTPLTLSEDTDRQEFLDSVSGSSRWSQNLMGYTRANHDPNKVASDDNQVLVEVETNRGMYVGGEGSSGHILPRGMELRPVNVGDFDVDDGQGGTTRRTVVQMKEVPRDERTVAQQ